MAGTIWEFFGFRAGDDSQEARKSVSESVCPIINETCEKTFNDGVVSGVCSLKPITSGPVICCPIRLYADDYKVLSDVVTKAFGNPFEPVPGKKLSITPYRIDRHVSRCLENAGEENLDSLRKPERGAISLIGSSQSWTRMGCLKNLSLSKYRQLIRRVHIEMVSRL